MQDDRIIGREDGPVGHVVINNPAKLNAVSLDMWEAAHALLTRYAENPAIRVVVVSGAGGKAFMSGADISKFESERANMEAQKRYDAISSRSYDLMYNFPKPTIAKIVGYCIGGGMNFAGCCDLRFCNTGARFGVPAAKLGLGYGFERVRRLAESIGLPKTLEVIYTGRQFSAQEALDMGFVQRVLADEELDAAVTDHRKRHRRERAPHHRPCQGRGARARQAGGEARPCPPRRHGQSLLRQPGLCRGSPRIHGKAQAQFPGQMRQRRPSPTVKSYQLDRHAR